MAVNHELESGTWCTAVEQQLSLCSKHELTGNLYSPGVVFPPPPFCVRHFCACLGCSPLRLFCGLPPVFCLEGGAGLCAWSGCSPGVLLWAFGWGGGPPVIGPSAVEFHRGGRVATLSEKCLGSVAFRLLPPHLPQAQQTHGRPAVEFHGGRC